ncbi:uncharacterized protein EI90DRAFT_2943014 [Cantharellus anzutake]|uniref:uncharacterized protein n=1 Tax=Cantharellus anzutake TaxID=1750568 RepID=UPI0019080177|nr:uncharacterized protein EI90DRAFT_2943014 [Cantharellus anzutake]KAF8317757.1 hypothetical protein EI90DRAFT_2943014 [Cantharellus anzutake]
MSESNKEEALKCIAVAKRHQNNGNIESAIRFCNKSLSLYETKEAKELLLELEEIPAPTPSSTPGSASTSSSTPSPTAGPSTTDNHTVPKDRMERVRVVRRIRACKPHAYYEILGLESSCSEHDIKRAFRKLAIMTHPDKTDVEGAAEAFKMVSKAWQILGDPAQRARYDAAPHADPTSRFSGDSERSPFETREVSPEEVFNMFFGGGAPFAGTGGFGVDPFVLVFTATFGPNGFQRTYTRPAAAQGNAQQHARSISPLLQALPLILLFAISFLGSLPNIASLFSAPDPGYSFTPSRAYSSERITSDYKVPYYVDNAEFERHPIYQSIPAASRPLKQAGASSYKLHVFEQLVERTYVDTVRNGCSRELEDKRRRMEQHEGFFGIGADWQKIEQIKGESTPSCQKLRDMGLLRY